MIQRYLKLLVSSLAVSFLIVFLKMGHPRPLFRVYFRLFKQQIYVKECYNHQEYGAGIRTHDLRNTSVLS